MTMRQRLTLEQAIESTGIQSSNIDWIKYDPNITAQYEIRRQSKHDTTLIFTLELILHALTPLLNRESYYRKMGVPPDDCEVRYTVGVIKLMSVYGLVDLPAGRFPGATQRVIIPVSCEYITRGE